MDLGCSAKMHYLEPVPVYDASDGDPHDINSFLYKFWRHQEPVLFSAKVQK
jgi:hypothetical protein